MQALEDVVPVQERGGYAQRAVGALHGDQLAVAEQLPDPALQEAETVSYFRDGQPIADETVGHRVNLCHISECPTTHAEPNPPAAVHRRFTSAVPRPVGGLRASGQPVIPWSGKGITKLKTSW